MYEDFHNQMVEIIITEQRDFLKLDLNCALNVGVHNPKQFGSLFHPQLLDEFILNVIFFSISMQPCLL